MTEHIGKCALCNETKTLKESHIIPKFVGKWLRRTSITGNIRIAQQPNKRVQDIIKEYLLCESCEQKFSSFEKPFAEKIFMPHQGGSKEFVYEEWLLKFIVSLQWRVIVYFKNTATGMSSQLHHDLEEAQEVFRLYLNDKIDDAGTYSHHLYLVDTNTEINGNYNIDGLYTYLLRSIDPTFITNGESTLSIFTKLPGMIIHSHITPRNMDGWVNTLVQKQGKIQFPQYNNIFGYDGLIESRIELSHENQISTIQRDKINENIQKNIDKLEKSKSYEAAIADLKHKR